MPSRKRNQEAKRAARAAERRKQRSNKKRSRRKRTQSGNAKAAGSTNRRADPSDSPGAHVRFVQPTDAVKTYRCPGCNGAIPRGLGHMVVVPPDDPDLRRHWHRGCWTNRHSRY